MLMGMLYADILYPYRPNNSFPERVVLVGMARIYLYISAWASALLVQTVWAMRRPYDVGRVTSTDSHVFSYIEKDTSYPPKRGKINLGKPMEHTGIINRRDWLF